MTWSALGVLALAAVAMRFSDDWTRYLDAVVAFWALAAWWHLTRDEL